MKINKKSAKIAGLIVVVGIVAMGLIFGLKERLEGENEVLQVDTQETSSDNVNEMKESSTSSSFDFIERETLNDGSYSDIADEDINEEEKEEQKSISVSDFNIVINNANEDKGAAVGKIENNEEYIFDDTKPELETTTELSETILKIDEFNSIPSYVYDMEDLKDSTSRGYLPNEEFVKKVNKERLHNYQIAATEYINNLFNVSFKDLDTKEKKDAYVRDILYYIKPGTPIKGKDNTYSWSYDYYTKFSELVSSSETEIKGKFTTDSDLVYRNGDVIVRGYLEFIALSNKGLNKLSGFSDFFNIEVGKTYSCVIDVQLNDYILRWYSESELEAKKLSKERDPLSEYEHNIYTVYNIKPVSEIRTAD